MNEHAFDAEKRKSEQKELDVFTHAKQLGEYIFQITKKAPKEYRWSIVNALLNESVNLVRALYTANSLIDDRRRDKQSEADTSLKTIGWLAGVAHHMQVFTNKQAEYLGHLALETRKSLWKWIKGSGTG